MCTRASTTTNTMQVCSHTLIHRAASYMTECSHRYLDSLKAFVVNVWRLHSLKSYLFNLARNIEKKQCNVLLWSSSSFFPIKIVMLIYALS